jgi:serine/threonine protein kinase
LLDWALENAKVSGSEPLKNKSDEERLTLERIEAVRQMATPARLTEDKDRTFQFSQPMARLQPEQLIAERYRVISLLGEGGMGCVYKVEQVFLKKVYALKTLAPSGITASTWRRFQKEAKAAALLDHPALIKVQDFGLIDGEQPFFVMDFVDGETLSTILKRGPMPLNVMLDVFTQACLGLGYAHSTGIIHRDIKPSNIMISGYPDLTNLKVKIVDFGIAKVLSSDDPESIAVTRTGEIFGTPYYMSPEQCIGTSIDDRSDIYSLGCCMFEALTGLPPFISETALTVMMKHQSERPPSLKEASLGTNFGDNIEKVVAKLLEKDPKQRYQNLVDVATDLQHIKNGQPILLGRQKPLLSGETTKTKSYTTFISFGLALIAAATIAFFVGRTTAPQPVAKEPPKPLNDAFFSVASDALVTNTIKRRSGYFSTQPVPNATWRLFHFPNESLGRIYQLGSDSKVYREKNGVFELEQTPNAMQDVVIDKFHSFGLIATPALTQNAQLFECFRPDEVRSVVFARTIGFSDAVLPHMLHLTAIRELDFDQVRDMTAKSIDYINQFPQLDHLNVGQSGLKFGDLMRLKRAKQLQAFDARSLGGDADAFLKMIAGSTQMRDLGLRRTKVSNVGLESIAAMPNLEILDLSATGDIDDDGIKTISRMRTLKQLSIEGCGHTTGKCLEYIKTMMNLKLLTLDPNHFHPDELKDLQASIPNCKITNGEHIGYLLNGLYKEPGDTGQ